MWTFLSSSGGLRAAIRAHRRRVVGRLRGPGPVAGRRVSARQSRRPNIVVVLVDDMRWDEMRVAGHPFIDTPHMDRLAREGARFLERLCHDAALLAEPGQPADGPVSRTPTASSTTRRGRATRCRRFRAALQRAGYRTAFFGKWHMGNDDSPRPGFDHWVAMPGQGEAIDPALNVDGKRVHEKGYTTDLLTDYVERFIDGPSDRPFLAYLAHKAIHPNVIQRDDGSVVPIPGQPGGFVGRRSPSWPLRRPRDAAARERVQAAGWQARAAAPDRPACRRSARRPPRTDEEIRGRVEMLLGRRR